MQEVIIALGIVGLLLICAEVLWRMKLVSPEISRKIIHVLGGISVAFWPYFMTFQTIQLLSIALFVGIAISYKFRIFGSIHNVKRSTKGELIYPIGIGACAFLASEPWIFTAAVMHLAIADGLAAVIGARWGKRTNYRIGPHHKSLLGTGAFFIVSLLIMTISYAILGGQELFNADVLTIIAIAGVATVIENITPYGFDNLAVPLVIVVLLSAA